jgi:alpha-1,2-mannosyltransferase
MHEVRETDHALLRRNWTVIAGIACAALAVLALQAFLHQHYSAVDEYDDGVYFGSSVELLHGVLPYRDFAFIQPPMITVWMFPFAALSTLTGTAIAMEAGRLFVDLVSVTNVALVGVLVRRRPTFQVVIATAAMAFSQGTIRASQTILLEPFVVLACLIAFLFLMEGEGVTSSSHRLWWCGIFFGIAGATKVWAVLPLLAAVIALAPMGMQTQRKVVVGAGIGFVACSLPFLIGAPISFFQQVVITQAIRNTEGFTLLARAADLTEIPGLSSSIERHSNVGAGLVALVLFFGFAALLICWTDRHRSAWSALERLSAWGAFLTGVGLLLSPTYFYHYSGFMAPFVALVMSSVAPRVTGPLRKVLSRRSLFLPTILGWFATTAAIALTLGTLITVIVGLPVAPQVGDAVSDAIPAHGCVLYANPTLALLDNRFTSDVSGCPDVIDWLGQERVLDNGLAAATSDSTDRHLQEVMSHWIDSSDGVVLESSDLGLDSTNVHYLRSHFAQEADIPRGLRIFVRVSGKPHKRLLSIHMQS